MKKYFFFLIGFLLVNSAFAYLDENSTCTSSTMNAASGNISLEAVEVPNVINIQWENADGTTYTTSTCTYDTQLQIPNAPAARLGYTFKGWKLDACSLAELDTSINGAESKRACLDLNGNGACTNDGVAANASLYGLDTAGQWAVLFEYGIVYGEAICSQTSGGTIANPGTPDTSWTGDTRYCWCRATGYKEDGGQKCTLSSSSWVSNDEHDSAATCAKICALNCMSGVQGDSHFRGAVFGQSQ